MTNTTESPTAGLLWTEKYRPRELKDVALSSENRALLEKYVAAGEIPHILLHGPPGTGKTTIAKILAEKLDCRLLLLNASSERGIDVIREKVIMFARAMSSARWQIVFLDEADRLTKEAQDALRNTMEDFAEGCRFILTGNHLHRVEEALQSRCQSIPVMDVPLRERAQVLMKVLNAEGVKFDPKVCLTYVQKFRDMRRMLSAAQRSVLVNGTLIPVTGMVMGGSDILTLVQQQGWEGLRALVADNAFDAQAALKDLFWAIPDGHKQCATIRWMVARAVHESNTTPDPIIHFLGLCSELMTAGA